MQAYLRLVSRFLSIATTFLIKSSNSSHRKVFSFIPSHPPRLRSHRPISLPGSTTAPTGTNRIFPITRTHFALDRSLLPTQETDPGPCENSQRTTTLTSLLATSVLDCGQRCIPTKSSKTNLHYCASFECTMEKRPTDCANERPQLRRAWTSFFLQPLVSLEPTHPPERTSQCTLEYTAHTIEVTLLLITVDNACIVGHVCVSAW
jgi:hypothetical protein